MKRSDASENLQTEKRRPDETPTVLLSDAPPPPAAAALAELTPGTLLGERYRIVSILGRGGMGVVYRADDLRLGQSIAVKFLTRRDRLNETRLYDEVRIGREVAHPNVCRLYDIAEIDGHLFITMEFVGGEDLSSLLRRIGRLPAEKGMAVARDVCSGLAAAHDKGIIHRDLKPANVLIDGRGRAHISDFGLAIPEERNAGVASAGTPAYMAPEQLDGGPATVQSDVYALGLLLYELFTGSRPFTATTTRELSSRQRAADYPAPSAIAKDIPPQVERIITRCLNPDPTRRPPSVQAVLVEIPAPDALSAAVAAGETPSPEMVAAASERGDLRRNVAAGLMSFVLAGVAGYALLTSSSMLYRRLTTLKSAEVLEDHARDIIAATGQGAPRGDSDFFFYTNRDDRGASATSTSLLFMYRQSPRALVTSGIERKVNRYDPPLAISGMSDVTLDASGRLVELRVVPPQVSSAAPHALSFDWTPFFASAGLNGGLTPVRPQWAAPVDSDTKQAWRVGNGPLRVEAATYRGKPVWFAVIYPWTRPDRMQNVQGTLMYSIQTAMIVAFMLVLPIVAIFLARRNVRRNRVDRRGAFRFAAAILLFSFGAAMFRAHHVSDFVAEWQLVSRLVADSTFWALMSWVAYVAIEPLVRRTWPRMLIGWSRLLEGRKNDPIVGRDILIGLAAGVLLSLVWEATALWPGARPLQMTTTPLSGTRHAAYYMLFGVVEATMRVLGLATLLLSLNALLRNHIRIAVALASVLLGLSFLDDPTGPVAARVICAAVFAGVAMFLIFRFGLLALSACAYAMLLLRNLPITADSTAFYFGRGLIATLILLALATYGFVASLGGKRLLPQLAD